MTSDCFQVSVCAAANGWEVLSRYQNERGEKLSFKRVDVVIWAQFDVLGEFLSGGYPRDSGLTLSGVLYALSR